MEGRICHRQLFQGVQSGHVYPYVPHESVLPSSTEGPRAVVVWGQIHRAFGHPPPPLQDLNLAAIAVFFQDSQGPEPELQCAF